MIQNKPVLLIGDEPKIEVKPPTIEVAKFEKRVVPIPEVKLPAEEIMPEYVAVDTSSATLLDIEGKRTGRRRPIVPPTSLAYKLVPISIADTF